MNPRKHISDELAQLGSTLPGDVPMPVFSVPAGYFDGFAASVLARLTSEARPENELETLSPLLAGISKKSPFTLPEGYFEGLSGDIPALVASEELSPMLSGIRNLNAYSVPVGYFENLAPALVQKTTPAKTGKLVGMGTTRWMRMAVAACIIGILSLGGIVYLREGNTGSNVGSQAWFNKKLKTVSDQELAEFIKTTDPHSLESASANNTTDVRTLMQDVSAEEMDDFLAQVPDEADEFDSIN